jgi:hypothetical protein
MARSAARSPHQIHTVESGGTESRANLMVVRKNNPVA